MAIKTRPKAALPLSSTLEKGTTHSPTYLLNTQTKKPGRPPSGKVRVTMLLDPDVIAKFKATGKGWQSRINDVLMAAKV